MFIPVKKRFSLRYTALHGVVEFIATKATDDQRGKLANVVGQLTTLATVDAPLSGRGQFITLSVHLCSVQHGAQQQRVARVHR